MPINPGGQSAALEPTTSTGSGLNTGLTLDDPLGDINKKLFDRFGELTDFGSKFFQSFRGFLGSMTPSPGANSFLSLLQAGGGNFGASQVQAKQLRRGAEGRRQDFLNTATKGFALESQGQANKLLGQISQNEQFMAQLAEMKRQFDDSQGGFLDFLGDIGGFALGIGLAPLTGGASLAIPAAMQFGKSSSFSSGGNQSRRLPARQSIF